jgi:hypothetical protein
MKNLIIGAASNYTYEQLQCWVNSAQKNTDADIVIVGSNIKNDDLQRLADKGVNFLLYGSRNENGEYVSEGVPHVERFFFIWKFLEENSSKYEYVLTTDTRDVIFQKDPFAFVHKTVGYDAKLSRNDILASSEGMLFKDEPWNHRNIHTALGSFFASMLEDELILNVGVIAGKIEKVRDLLFFLFQMSVNRSVPIVDQAVYNMLIRNNIFGSCTYIAHNQDAWTAQLGTTYKALEAGKGDIGIIAKHNPSLLIDFQLKYKDEQPTITDDGLVLNKQGQEFCIVHQYDRIPTLEKKIREKYNG